MFIVTDTLLCILSACRPFILQEHVSFACRFLDDQIKGIVVDGNEIKWVIYGNNMTSFDRDKLSHRTLLDTLKLFGTYSGLKVN